MAFHFAAPLALERARYQLSWHNQPTGYLLVTSDQELGFQLIKSF